jgi:hypothetical protein
MYDEYCSLSMCKNSKSVSCMGGNMMQSNKLMDCNQEAGYIYIVISMRTTSI